MSNKEYIESRFSNPIVSREEIKESLIARASKRGDDLDRIELLIEWRLAACNYFGSETAKSFYSDYKLSDMQGHVSSGSRGIDAFNWVSVIEGRNDTLSDAGFEQRIKEMERMHHISRFFKNSQIKIDLNELVRQARNSTPNAPMYFDLPASQLNQRSDSDMVYEKGYNEPSYTRETLQQIDARAEEDYSSSGEKRKRPNANAPAFFNKSKYGMN